jgi:hypothetical protein
MNKKFLFLISWVAFSESAGGEDTGVNSRFDLIQQYDMKNRNVSAYECDTPEDGIVKAFFDNYTAKDSAWMLVASMPDGSFVEI